MKWGSLPVERVFGERFLCGKEKKPSGCADQDGRINLPFSIQSEHKRQQLRRSFNAEAQLRDLTEAMIVFLIKMLTVLFALLSVRDW